MNTIINMDNDYKVNWDFVSRFFIGFLFIISGLFKVANFEEVNQGLSNALGEVSLAPQLSLIAIIVEIVFATLYIFNYKYRDISGYVLIAFTAVVTVLMHSNLENVTDQTNTLKNLAIIGGILATLHGVQRRRG
jgi:uncharacterized membrane protein YphA (DoxX/SURF4 family)